MYAVPKYLAFQRRGVEERTMSYLKNWEKYKYQLERERKKAIKDLIRAALKLVFFITGIILCLTWFDWKLLAVILFVTEIRGHAEKM